MTEAQEITNKSVPRVKVTVRVAFVVFFAYVIVVHAIQYSSGIPYTEFFASAENAWRSANFSLIVAALMLLAFAFWSRWDGIWKDAQRLPMTPLMWLAPILFVVLMGLRLGFKFSEGVALDLLLAIVVAGVGVGVAEELLFRGVILRALRTNGRTEAWAIVWCALWFGMMHSMNAFLGAPLYAVAIQVVLASLSGITLYLLRRSFGLLFVAMLAHGLWDISAFLPAPKSNEHYAVFEIVELALAVIAASVGGFVAIRHGRNIVVAQDSIVRSVATGA